MKFNWLERLGDWNPQLMRELKGRLKLRNLLIAGVISLLGQFLLLMFFQAQLPNGIKIGGIDNQNKYYCSDIEYVQPYCRHEGLGNSVFNLQLWWLELFVWLSVIGIFALIVVGTYLLISDLAHEERRGTLNFIRLSPQSPENILVGKLLGVPILLYLVAVLAVPLHLWAGLAAQISLIRILSFYGVLIAACFFFYSSALLFSLVSSWLGGFQAWLGSGGVLIFLYIASFKPIDNTLFDWLNLFSPPLLLQYLIAATGLNPAFSFSSYLIQDLNIQHLQWFYLPVGVSTLIVVSLLTLNYGLWTYWCWQGLKRRFPNSTKAILSKQQSYLLVACFQVMSLGFALQWVFDDGGSPTSPGERTLYFNFNCLLLLGTLLFLGLTVVLTPPYQTLQDWARYSRKRGSSRKSFWNKALVQDLIWGEKSPAIVAIALNLIITATFLAPWAMFGLEEQYIVPALLSLLISFNLILIYAAIAHLIVLRRTQKQIWVVGTLSAVILLPTFICGFLSFFAPQKMAGLALFTPFAWAAIESSSATTVFLSLLVQWGILTLLTLQITRQLRKAGESAFKALFAANR